MKIVVTHASSLPWKNNFYDAIYDSQFYKTNDVFLPQEENKHEQITKELIENSGLVIAEVSYPSTGQGIELGWADIYKRPIICVFQEKSTISNSLKFLTNRFISYNRVEDLMPKLEQAIKEMK